MQPLSVKRGTDSQQRVVKPRLSDLVKAAHEAGAQVSVSLEKKTTKMWHVSYIAPSGRVIAHDVAARLMAMEVVARALNLNTPSISIQLHYCDVA